MSLRYKILIYWDQILSRFFCLFSFLCLHPNGWLRNLCLDIKSIESEEAEIQNNYKTESRLLCYLKKITVQYLKNQSDGDRSPFLYYTHAIDSNECGNFLGLGDFITYNTLLLLILSPISSIATKLYVTFGCIISIIIGLLLTYWLGRSVKQSCLPGVPLSVITFSTYIFFLDIFMTHPNDCTELPFKLNHIDVNKYLN